MPAGFAVAGLQREGDPRCTDSACSPRLILKLHSTLSAAVGCQTLGLSLKRWPGTADVSDADPIAAPESGYHEVCDFSTTQGSADQKREIQASVFSQPGQPIDIAIVVLEP